jgi:hypothetical protein
MRKAGPGCVFIPGAYIVQNIYHGHGRAVVLVDKHFEAVGKHKTVEFDHDANIRLKSQS